MIEQSARDRASNVTLWRLLGEVTFAAQEYQEAADALMESARGMFGKDHVVDYLLQNLSCNPDVALPRPQNFQAPPTRSRGTPHPTPFNHRARQ